MLPVLLKAPHNPGREQKEKAPSCVVHTELVTGSLLLFISISLIALPEMHEDARSFMLAAFACVALLQGN